MTEQKRISESLEQLKIDSATVIAKMDMINDKIDTVYAQVREESSRLRSLENKNHLNNDNKERIQKIEQEVNKVQSQISKAIGILLVVSPMYVGLITWLIKAFTSL